MPNPKRDLEAERGERESFILLQHAYTLSEGESGVAIPADRLGHELGFGADQLAALVRHLERVGYLAVEGGGRRAAVSPAGVEYIERLAWRRRSVRAPEPTALGSGTSPY